MQPSLLIADEPTTALDVTIQAQIVELVQELRKRLGMAVIWITHDLGVIARLAERVIVMYAGHIVEEAPVKDVYGNPRHPYTLGLLGSLPRLDEAPGAKLFSIEGQPPDQPNSRRDVHLLSDVFMRSNVASTKCLLWRKSNGAQGRLLAA